MEPVKIQYVLLNENAKPFAYSRPNDACMDVYSGEDIWIGAGDTIIVHTGIALAIPEGYEGRIRGRSGWTSKGLLVQHGTIDHEYRGEIGVIIYNSLPEPVWLNIGDRIAQFSIKKVVPMELVKVASLDETVRGMQGFGSSGD